MSKSRNKSQLIPSLLRLKSTFYYSLHQTLLRKTWLLKLNSSQIICTEIDWLRRSNLPIDIFSWWCTKSSVKITRFFHNKYWCWVSIYNKKRNNCNRIIWLIQNRNWYGIYANLIKSYSLRKFCTFISVNIDIVEKLWR